MYGEFWRTPFTTIVSGHCMACCASMLNTGCRYRVATLRATARCSGSEPERLWVVLSVKRLMMVMVMMVMIKMRWHHITRRWEGGREEGRDGGPRAALQGRQRPGTSALGCRSLPLLQLRAWEFRAVDSHLPRNRSEVDRRKRSMRA
eukprot:7251595-Pyramimonas_sp.AAC.1